MRASARTGWTIAIVAALCSVGFALLVTRDAGDSVPFQTASPRAGDHATYLMANESAAFEVVVTWGAAETLRGSDGAEHLVDVVHVEWQSADRPASEDGHGGRTAWLQAGTGRAIAVGIRTHETRPTEWGAGADFDGLLSASQADVVLQDLWFDRPGHCLATHAAQRAPLGQAGPLRLLEPCQLWPFGGQTLGVGAFEAAGIEEVAGYRAVRFASPAVDVWLAPDVPYAVKLAVSGGPVATLASFVAGDEPIPARDELPGADGAMAMERRAALPWGADDEGVASPFPLSLAYQQAMSSLSWPDFRDWAQAHPDHVAAWAGISVTLYQDRAERRWTVVFVADDSYFPLLVLQHDTSGFVWRTAGLTAEPMALRYEFARFEPDPEVLAALPPRAAIPADWPTVASLQTRWQAHMLGDDPSAPPDSWPFTVACTDAECSTTTVEFRVYRWHVAGSVRGMIVGDGQIEAEAVNVLTIRDDGTALRHRAAYDAVAFEGLLADVTAPPGAGGRTPEDTAPAMGTADWRGALPLAAGAGLAAGAIAWLMHALATAKGPFAAMFSRLAAPDLLNHPLRRRILALVEAEPGIHFQGLARRLRLGHGGLTHHLDQLVARGLLGRHRGRGATCYFPRGFPADLRPTADVLHSASTATVLAAVLAHPGRSGRKIARACGLSPPATHHQLQRLGAAGLVDSVRGRTELRVRPTRLALAAADAGLVREDRRARAARKEDPTHASVLNPGNHGARANV